MKSYEFAALATYNSEVARGIVHTPEWRARMAAEQARFNEQQRQWATENGHIIVSTRKDNTATNA